MCVQTGKETERRLRSKYDELWRANISRIRRGQIEIDPVLATRSADLRRGLTLLARPSAPVRQRIATLLAEVRRLEPDQYYYARSEFHVTILSLFTGTVEHERFFARLDDYVAATALPCVELRRCALNLPASRCRPRPFWSKAFSRMVP